MSEKPPLWREILNWGCVIYFLALPAMVIVIGLFDIEVFTEAQSGARQFLGNFYLSVSALVAAMAGLNSFDRYKTNGQKSEKEK